MRHIMGKTLLIFATLLGLAACEPRAVEQSGSSGVDLRVVGSPVDQHGCGLGDINCRVIYNGAGGG
jgi:hypothetical protein